MDASVITRNLCKSFASLDVLVNWNVTIKKAERIVLLGPSGSGKTTFLKIIAGLYPPTSGEIKVNAEKLGFVFQEPRLIPWLTVKDNLAFVNEHGNISDILNKLRLQGFEDYFPSQLSGGMQQRVNLARSLLVKPDLLILDEAFTSLDLPVKITIMEDILLQWKNNRFTLIAVTHDLKEALFLADRIFIISHSPAKIVCQFPVQLGEDRKFSAPESLQMESELLDIISK